MTPAPSSSPSTPKSRRDRALVPVDHVGRHTAERADRLAALTGEDARLDFPESVSRFVVKLECPGDRREPQPHGFPVPVCHSPFPVAEKSNGLGNSGFPRVPWFSTTFVDDPPSGAPEPVDWSGGSYRSIF